MSRLLNSALIRRTPPVEVEASGRLPSGPTQRPFDIEAQKENPLKPLLRIDAKAAAQIYTICPQVYSVVSLRASMISALPLKIYWEKADGTRQELNSGKLYDLFQNPNPKTTRTQFINQVITWYDLTGTAVVVAEEIEGKMYLFVLNSAYVFPIVDEKFGMDGIIYTKHDNKKIYYDKSQVVKWSRINPVDDFFGMSPLQPLIEDIMARRSAIKQTRNHYAKGGISSGILKVQDNLAPELLSQMKRDWNRRTEDSSRLIVLADGWDFAEIKGSEGNISASELNNLTRETICNAYNVPIALMNPEKNTHPQESEQFFWTSVLIPQANELSELLTNWLGANNGRSKITISLDYSRVPILQKFRIDAAKATTALISIGLMTLNEGRDELDYAPYTGTLEVDLENIDLGAYADSPIPLYNSLLTQKLQIETQQEQIDAQAMLADSTSGRDQSADGEPQMVDTTGRR